MTSMGEVEGNNGDVLEQKDLVEFIKAFVVV
jgi:hypothetical protein